MIVNNHTEDSSPKLSSLLKMICENVEKQLRIRISIDVTMCLEIQEFRQLLGIGQITILEVTSVSMCSI